MRRRFWADPEARKVIYEHKGLLVRQGTTDKELAGGIEREYKTLNPSPGDVILDIGACFGAFAVWAKNHGAYVISVEPMPENYDLLTKNYSGLCINAAVVRLCETPTIKLFISNSRSMGSHTLKPTRGRESIVVPTVALGDLLEEYKPNKIKCDCEGEEYNLFINNKLPSNVVSLIFEFHFNKRRDDLERGMMLDAQLISQGFKHTKQPWFGPKNWHTIAGYAR